jgi:hypothetical protein
MTKSNVKKSYIYVTIPEAAARMGVNSRRIHYLLDHGKMEDNGCRGTKRRVKYETDAAESKTAKESHDEARRRKTVAEANLIEQKSLEFQQRLFDKWSNEFFAVFSHAFGPFKTAVVDLRLDTDKTKKLNELFNLCMTNLHTELKTISDSVNS